MHSQLLRTFSHGPPHSSIRRQLNIEHRDAVNGIARRDARPRTISAVPRIRAPAVSRVVCVRLEQAAARARDGEPTGVETRGPMATRSRIVRGAARAPRHGRDQPVPVPKPYAGLELDRDDAVGRAPRAADPVEAIMYPARAATVRLVGGRTNRAMTVGSSGLTRPQARRWCATSALLR